MPPHAETARPQAPPAETLLPLRDYALLSDCHSAALLGRTGSIDWLCFPRFDSPSIFARLLDPQGGQWMLGPDQAVEATRRYLGPSLVVETLHRTDDAEVRVTDALPVGPNERGHELGKEAPHAVLRLVEGIKGEMPMRMDFAPRAEYGLVRPLILPHNGGFLARAGASVLTLSTPLETAISDGTATSRFTVKKGQRHAFALQYGRTASAAPEHWDEGCILERIDETLQAWTSWSAEHQGYHGPYKELVDRSASVLQGLTYAPTGAMVAAPTTSLPETIGGVRNWDYRYCWVRDASFTLNALWVAACPDEAEKFFEFLAHAALAPVQSGGRLQIVFGIAGEHDLTEREIPHLSGWNASSPVRIGNAAWEQDQLDIHGELLDAAYRLRDQLKDIPDVTRRFLAAVADAAAERWQEDDHGLWEIRGKPAPYVYSKLMCWVALDRAIRLAEELDARDRVPHWKDARDKIRDAIMKRGWSDSKRSFTQAFGNDAIDASNLVIPLVGFLPADHPKVQGTLRAIREELMDDRGLVWRYRSVDGLPGDEGTFLLCTFWFAEAQARSGDLAGAKKTFEAACSYANDLGLLSEEIDVHGQLIGNFPQAFSHVGLVNAAWAITESENGTGD